MVDHGTPEGYRLHRKLEHEPCPACRGAMGDLMQRVRSFQISVRGISGALPAFTAHPSFSAYQRTLQRPADQVQGLPALPPPSMPAVVCAGDEAFLPRGPRAVAKRAAAAGWWVRTTRAAGPRIDARGEVPPGREQVFTIAVAVARRDDRLVWLWHYIERSGEWSWALDDVFWNRKGTINDTEGKGVLNA